MFPDIRQDYDRILEYLEDAPFAGKTFDGDDENNVFAFPIYSPEGADIPAAVVVYRLEPSLSTIFVNIAAVHDAREWRRLRLEAFRRALEL